ncbi:hypothetical protein SDC9_135679 [bioreactor metagenome]|uniref:Uncharacterized protein n=1 Tax=bioreactor metagenome TaxID=1076179 RepID=A0A645DH86_9ZZZZ
MSWFVHLACVVGVLDAIGGAGVERRGVHGQLGAVLLDQLEHELGFVVDVRTLRVGAVDRRRRDGECNESTASRNRNGLVRLQDRVFRQADVVITFGECGNGVVAFVGIGGGPRVGHLPQHIGQHL